MFSHVFVALLVFKNALCQINGEFWWLNEKVAQLQHIAPPQPTFEEVSELETDESVQIKSRDSVLFPRENPTDIENKDTFLDKNKVLPFIVFLRNHTKLLEPEYDKINIIGNNGNNLTSYKEEENNSLSTISKKEAVSKLTTPNKTNKDEFDFVFPDNNKFLWDNTIKNNTYTDTSKKITNENNKINKPSKTTLNEKIWFEEDKMLTESESICTFIIPRECIANNGLIHKSGKICQKNIESDTRKICCILPLTSTRSQNLDIFYNRHKRSDPEEALSTALKQRNALLMRNYNNDAHQAKTTTTSVPTRPIQKIVTPGDHIDPYWNIKNAKFRNPNKQSKINQDYENSQHDGTRDYDEDYGVELPKPGLVGLYSDREDRVTSWKLKTNKGFSYSGIDDESDEDSSEEGFGYSTIDPRLSNRKSTRPLRRNPSHNKDFMSTLESQTVHFHSTPDFHVLEGFKLINLADNKNRHTKKTTTKIFHPSEEELLIENTSPVITNIDSDYDGDIDMNQQVFRNCGKKKITPVNDAGLGTEDQTDPWLAVIVLTKNPKTVLCYATLVHPRAAVTAASCVHGKAPGQLSTIAGLWDLHERTNTQHRMCSIYIHPQFKPNDLANDLAIVHWKRPLRLQANVLPACLADPHVGDDCYFIGWGGYDQDFQQLPKWQPANILTPRTCNEKLSSPDVELPPGAFCASVKTRGTVTGVGGPLLCKGGERTSVVAVAIYREDVIVLLPAYEWVTNALKELHI